VHKIRGTLNSCSASRRTSNVPGTESPSWTRSAAKNKLVWDLAGDLTDEERMGREERFAIQEIDG